MCGASWDDIAADYNRTSDLQISEFRHSNQLRHALYLLTGFDPLILPSGPDAVPSVYTATTLEDAIASHTAYSGGKALYNYPAIGTPLPTLQDAVAAHFVEGGYLTEGEIDVCVAKLRGDEQTPTGIVDLTENQELPHVQKVLRDGSVLIIHNGVTYDVWGRFINTQK